MALAGRFFRAADEVGYGVDVEDGELSTGTPADDMILTNIQMFLFTRIISRFTYLKGTPVDDNQHIDLFIFKNHFIF